MVRGIAIPGNRDRSRQPDKHCSKCGLGPPYVEFAWQGNRWTSQCRTCRRLAYSAYNRGAKGKARTRLYLSTDKRPSLERNPAYRARVRRYLDTPLGKIGHLIGRERQRIKVSASPEVKASSRRRLALYLAERERIYKQRRDQRRAAS